MSRGLRCCTIGISRSFLCGLITPASHPDPLFRLANPTRASNQDPSHGPVALFLIFLVDRFHLVPVPVRVSLHALFLKAIETHTLPPYRAEHIGSDSHAYRYQALPSRIISLIKPVSGLWSLSLVACRIASGFPVHFGHSVEFLR
ncbi:unnamed protein product [Protopolystoma xenopodis]|uniref:Uncharacterized protein n=1 Tax=Protopolystoma xenopodis TaxID=117903 RepID=A0A448XD27_9PLAT|nr:unnamed protein product [Protopolystoma xenopodis]